MKSPWDLLPVQEPMLYAPPEADYFYNNVSKPLIPDIVRIMDNGIPIDFDRVKELEDTVDNVLEAVKETLAHNKIIREFLLIKHKNLKKSYVKENEEKKRTAEHYLKEFKPKDMVHRSYYMTQITSEATGELMPTGVAKWTVKDVKQYVSMFPNPDIDKLLEGNPTAKLANDAMVALANDKMKIYNKSYEDKIDTVDLMKVPDFNPASSQQKILLFEWLGLESEEFSKDTGLPSWSRNQIERIQRETDDEDMIEFTQAFIDHSFSAIIKNNFISSFYEFSIDNILYGNLKLFGAKS